MFTPSFSDKGSLVEPENSSPGRASISERFPVGIKSIRDENQQIRIQLAVHKYNNSPTYSGNNKRSYVSSIRHSFLKNSPKNHEEDAEPVVKGERKTVNRYEGVGAFPTVHLKKNAVRYRPIKKFNEVKVPCPELPVTRFLSNLPELIDLKSNTRSVLDVLQDLSRKKIHSKDENDFTKNMSKGLGGDYVTGADVAYKPLFVQNTKVKAVLTRDNTTQTLLSHSGNSSPAVSELTPSVATPENSDPKAELRKKLAKQNNEIFASLSSSVPPTFAVKRKIDTITPSEDKNYLDDTTANKKQKVYIHHKSNSEEKSTSKFNILSSNENSLKLTRKNKLSENSSVSPNKDRLTTIYFEMQNVSPKAQIFQKDSNSAEKKTPVENGTLSSANSKSSNSINCLFNKEINGSAENTSLNNTGSSLQKSPVFNFTPPTGNAFATLDSDKKENKTEKNGLKTFKTNGADNLSQSNGSSTQVNVKVTNSPTFTFGTYPVTSLSSGNTSMIGGFMSTITNSSFNTGSKPNNTNSISQNNTEKSTDQGANKSFKLEVMNNDGVKNISPSTFKFENTKNSASAEQSSVLNPISEKSNEPSIISSKVSTSDSLTPNSTLQFSFGMKAPVVTSATVTPPTSKGVQFGQNISLNSTTPTSKPTFTFGQNSVTIQQNQSENSSKGEEKNGSSNFQINQTPNSGAFSFGQNTQPKNVFETQLGNSSNKLIFSGSNTGQNNAEKTPSQSTLTSPSGNTNNNLLKNINTGQNSSQTTGSTTIIGSGSAISTSNSLFEQKPTVSTSTNTFVTAPEEHKAQQNFSFNVEQKNISQNANQNKTSETSVFKSPSLFSFGQKTSTENSTQSNVVTTNTSSQLSNPQTDLSKSTTQSQFGLSSSQVVNAPQVTNQTTSFGSLQNSVTGSANSSMNKSETNTFGQNSSTFSQNKSAFPSKISPFGNMTSAQKDFGTSNSQSTNGFGTSTSSQSNMTFNIATTTQGAPTFGTSTAQAAPTFGTSTTQAAPTFGASTTQAAATFGASTTQSAPTFGASTTQSAPTFGASTTQSAPTFGASTTQSAPTFGASTTQAAPTFGASTTQSTPTFGVSTTQTAPTFGASTTQAAPTFGAPTTQAAPTFGAPTTQPASTFRTSTTQGAPTFGTSTSNQAVSTFGVSSNTQSGVSFEQPIATKSSSAFEVPSSSQAVASFGSSTTTQPSAIFGFSNSASTQPNTNFTGPTSSQSTTGFGLNSSSQPSFGQPFGQNTNKGTTSAGQISNIFGQTTTAQNPVTRTTFGSGSNTNFDASTNQNNIFAQKTDSTTNMFDQNTKFQSSPFGQNVTSPSFGTQNKFSFGLSTSNTTGFTTSPPNTTASSVFSFGSSNNSSAQDPNFCFAGAPASGSVNTQTPFAFKVPTNETFKFGAFPAKDGSGFGNSAPAPFSFGNQMNTNVTADAKSLGTGFNFGSAPAASSAPAFNFGSASSPSLFNFGASGSSAGTNSGFNFGAPQPGGPFGKTSTPSPAPFTAPGTFSIGSGSSQSRPRASSRLRRRP